MNQRQKQSSSSLTPSSFSSDPSSSSLVNHLQHYLNHNFQPGSGLGGRGGTVGSAGGVGVNLNQNMIQQQQQQQQQQQHQQQQQQQQQRQLQQFPYHYYQSHNNALQTNNHSKQHLLNSPSQHQQLINHQASQSGYTNILPHHAMTQGTAPTPNGSGDHNNTILHSQHQSSHRGSMNSSAHSSGIPPPPQLATTNDSISAPAPTPTQGVQMQQRQRQSSQGAIKNNDAPFSPLAPPHALVHNLPPNVGNEHKNNNLKHINNMNHNITQHNNNHGGGGSGNIGGGMNNQQKYNAPHNHQQQRHHYQHSLEFPHQSSSSNQYKHLPPHLQQHHHNMQNTTMGGKGEGPNIGRQYGVPQPPHGMNNPYNIDNQSVNTTRGDTNSVSSGKSSSTSSRQIRSRGGGGGVESSPGKSNYSTNRHHQRQNSGPLAIQQLHHQQNHTPNTLSHLSPSLSNNYPHQQQSPYTHYQQQLHQNFVASGMSQHAHQQQQKQYHDHLLPSPRASIHHERSHSHLSPQPQKHVQMQNHQQQQHHHQHSVSMHGHNAPSTMQKMQMFHNQQHQENKHMSSSSSNSASSQINNNLTRQSPSFKQHKPKNIVIDLHPNHSHSDNDKNSEMNFYPSPSQHLDQLKSPYGINGPSSSSVNRQNEFNDHTTSSAAGKGAGGNLFQSPSNSNGRSSSKTNYQQRKAKESQMNIKDSKTKSNRSKVSKQKEQKQADKLQQQPSKSSINSNTSDNNWKFHNDVDFSLDKNYSNVANHDGSRGMTDHLSVLEQHQDAWKKQEMVEIDSASRVSNHSRNNNISDQMNISATEMNAIFATEYSSSFFPIPQNRSSLTKQREGTKFKQDESTMQLNSDEVDKDLHTAKDLPQRGLIKVSPIAKSHQPSNTKKRKQSSSSTSKNNNTLKSKGNKAPSSTLNDSSQKKTGKESFIHDVLPMIQSLAWDEQLIYVLQHIMHDIYACDNGNEAIGFYSTLSSLHQLKTEMMSNETSDGNTKKKKKKKVKVKSDAVNSEKLDFSKVENFEVNDIVASAELNRLEANPDVAEKMMIEMAKGLTYCQTISNTIDSILNAIDTPSQTPSQRSTPKKMSQGKKSTSASSGCNTTGIRSNSPTGDSRKADPIEEASHKFFEVIRFRSLDAQKGDCVAFQKHLDLWILARVVKDWKQSDDSGSGGKLAKVHLQDIEEYDPRDSSKTKIIERKYVIPLSRSIKEGNEWSSRYYKGMRVYAMYPNTTSLYPATVVDNTTYCKKEHIVVVEFDGDEDEKMNIPQRHIPSRFVAPIPPQFKKQQKKTKPNKEKPQSSRPSSLGQINLQKPMPNTAIMMGKQKNFALDLNDGVFE